MTKHDFKAQIRAMICLLFDVWFLCGAVQGQKCISEVITRTFTLNRGEIFELLLLAEQVAAKKNNLEQRERDFLINVECNPKKTVTSLSFSLFFPSLVEKKGRISIHLLSGGGGDVCCLRGNRQPF